MVKRLRLQIAALVLAGVATVGGVLALDAQGPDSAPLDAATVNSTTTTVSYCVQGMVKGKTLHMLGPGTNVRPRPCP